jgi:DNA-binding GntR family transcriptional regulator
MAPIVRQSLHDAVLAQLRKRVVEAYWPAGSVIPEALVCQELDVSRTPVREALKVLAAEGLVELLPRSGARVKLLSPTEVRELFETIAILEAAAGRAACERASDAEIESIRALHQELLAAHGADDRAGYFDANKRIHLAIARASGNEVLANMHQQLMTRMQRVRFACSREDNEWARSIHEHDDIFDALSRRDGTRLAELIMLHMDHGWERVSLVVEQEAAQFAAGRRVSPSQAFLGRAYVGA